MSYSDGESGDPPLAHSYRTISWLDAATTDSYEMSVQSSGRAHRIKRTQRQEKQTEKQKLLKQIQAFQYSWKVIKEPMLII